MQSKDKKHSVFIGLTDPKSPTNVGAVMRAAGCYQADKVLYTGQRYDRAAKFYTDTKNVSEHIPLQQVDSFIDYKKDGRKLVCVDLVEGAIALPDFEHPDEAIYVFGAEDSSVSQKLVDNADAVVYVPTIGCMNLAASVNVLLYDRLAKQRYMDFNDELIVSSRDTNNKVSVKGA